MAEPHLPDGTPTKTLACRYCGCLGYSHIKGSGACIGPIENMPAAVPVDEALMDNLRRGVKIIPLHSSALIECPKRCKAYCAPGGIQILN